MLITTVARVVAVVVRAPARPPCRLHAPPPPLLSVGTCVLPRATGGMHTLLYAAPVQHSIPNATHARPSFLGVLFSSPSLPASQLLSSSLHTSTSSSAPFHSYSASALALPAVLRFFSSLGVYRPFLAPHTALLILIWIAQQRCCTYALCSVAAHIRFGFPRPRLMMHRPTTCSLTSLSFFPIHSEAMPHWTAELSTRGRAAYKNPAVSMLDRRL